MNIKKLFPDNNKSAKKGILEFLDNRGFYIILVICIVIVGATAVFVMTYNANIPGKGFDAEKFAPEDTMGIGMNNLLNEEETTSAQSSTVKQQASDIDGKTGQGSDSAINAAKKSMGSAASGQASAGGTGGQATGAASDNSGTAKPASASNDSTAKVTEIAQNNLVNRTGGKDNKETGGSSNKTPQATPGASKSTGSTIAASRILIMPVHGDVINVFAADKLIYSKTLEEWRTHSGVDIAADRGTLVKAAADGVVTEIKTDPRYGITILIDHQNGVKTIYSNLASDEVVSPNQKVKQGDIIGAVGNTAFFESAEQSHLHFEVMKNDVPVNPEAYLQKSAG